MSCFLLSYRLFYLYGWFNTPTFCIAIVDSLRSHSSIVLYHEKYALTNISFFRIIKRIIKKIKKRRLNGATHFKDSMKKNAITRAYLESLSFADLLALADTYGIDVPDNLNRRFLIGELLDVAREADDEPTDMIIAREEGEIPAPGASLPESYNMTQIGAVLRSPAWIYVYWDIGESDIRSLQKHGEYTIFLRVCSFADRTDIKPDDAYDVQIAPADTSEYLLCPAGKKIIRIELAASVKTGTIVLASSGVLEIPRSSKLLAHIRPGNEAGITPIASLSGIKELLLDHYIQHRESFL